MNEYKIKYEAHPISEVTKEKIIAADTFEAALELFRDVYDGEIISIELF